VRLHFTIVLLVLGAPALVAQEPVAADSIVAREASETLLEDVLTESEDEQLLEYILWLKENPLDLNRATIPQLEAMPGISPMEAQRVIEFRERVGRFSSIEQLREVDGGGIDLARRLGPFVHVGGSELTEIPSPLRVQVRARVISDLQQRRGFQTGAYAGTVPKMYQRVLVQSGKDIEAGIVLEKDAGERFGDGFVAGYARLRDLPGGFDVLAGDYTVGSGQGLLLSRSSSFGKGSEVVQGAMRSGSGISPHRSTEEFSFFRGVAVSKHTGVAGYMVTTSVFFSRRQLHGTPVDEHAISSFYRDGLFRTESELRRRGTFSERVIGGRLELAAPSLWKIGLSGVSTTFDRNIVPSQALSFSGKRFQGFSIDGRGTIGDVTLVGEVARTRDAGAGIASILLPLGRRTAVIASYRNYSPHFAGLYANGFNERATQNETGLYVGVRTSPLRGTKVAFYVDHFRYPKRTFSNLLPASGYDLLAQVESRFSRQVELVGRYSMKSVESTAGVSDAFLRSVREVVERTQQRARLGLSVFPEPALRLRGRIEYTRVDYRYTGRREQGLLVYQDARYRSAAGLTVEARVVFFDTDSFDSRVYAYENDLSGVFSNPAFFGKGRRWYLLLSQEIGAAVRVTAKYAETSKPDVAAMGSGLAEIPGAVDNRVSIQLDLGL
jgi:hypothetical protein